jgi:hypothetical protein
MSYRTGIARWLLFLAVSPCQLGIWPVISSSWTQKRLTGPFSLSLSQLLISNFVSTTNEQAAAYRATHPDRLKLYTFVPLQYV